MLALTGTMYATPATPSGISSVKAASGPYAAELSASRPKMGIPAEASICSARSSDVANGLPNSMSTTDMPSPPQAGTESVKHAKGEFRKSGQKSASSVCIFASIVVIFLSLPFLEQLHAIQPAAGHVRRGKRDARDWHASAKRSRRLGPDRAPSHPGPERHVRPL